MVCVCTKKYIIPPWFLGPYGDIVFLSTNYRGYKQSKVAMSAAENSMPMDTLWWMIVGWWWISYVSCRIVEQVMCIYVFCLLHMNSF